MPYDLMLLADPGPQRARVLQLLRGAPDVRPDPALDNRFWLETPHGAAQVNVGTKDPVESVHLEFGLDDPALMEAVTLRALELGAALEMRVEDMQFGAEIDAASLPALRDHWRRLVGRPAPADTRPEGARRPWRFW